MEAKQKSTAKQETSKTNEVPKWNNDVFNHDSTEGMEGATGCTREHMDKLVDKLNEGIMSDETQKFSHAIEVVFKNTTHKELSVLFMQQHYQRNRAGFADFLTSMLGK